MDITALQATLRQFAAERDWQPFHTPRNLAMALKTKSRPARRAGLVASVKALIGPAASNQTADAVLAELLAVAR